VINRANDESVLPSSGPSFAKPLVGCARWRRKTTSSARTRPRLPVRSPRAQGMNDPRAAARR